MIVGPTLSCTPMYPWRIGVCQNRLTVHAARQALTAGQPERGAICNGRGRCECMSFVIDCGKASLNHRSPHRPAETGCQVVRNMSHQVSAIACVTPASNKSTAAQPAAATAVGSHHSPCDWRACPSNRRLRTSASTFYALFAIQRFEFHTRFL